MSNYLLTPASRLDLLEIWTYFADEVGDIELADRFTASAEEAFGQLARNPGLGPRRRFQSAMLKGVRSWRIKDFPKFLVFYREGGGVVQVVRVLHGARDLTTLFAEE